MKKTRRSGLIAGFLTTTVAISSAPVLTGPTSGATAAEPETPTAAYGTFPEMVTDVSVSALPDLTTLADGTKGYEFKIESADVNVWGREFEIGINPTSVPADYIDDEGLVSLAVYATTADGRGLRTSTSVRLIATHSSPSQRSRGDEAVLVWSDPVGSSGYVDDSDPAVAVTTARGTARVPVVRAEGDTADEEFEDDGSDVDKRDFFEIPPEYERGGCYTVGETRGTTSYVRSTTIGTTYPATGDTARMVIRASQGAAYGIAGKGEYSGASFKASGSKFVKTEWEFSWDFRRSQRSYRKGILYRKYGIWCQSGYNVVKIGTEWRPYSETGGTGSNTGITRPGWNTYCARVDAGVWQRKNSSGTAYAYGAAVKFAGIIGIDLSIERNYSSEQYIAYDLEGNNQKLCGSNTYPAKAGKIIERPVS